MKRAAAVAVLSLLAVAALWVMPATAADKDPGSMMLVLDSSGSMKEKASGGMTKIAAAKKSLGTVIDDLPANQSVGLRVYGAKVFSAKDKGACTDSQRVVDLGTDNRVQLKSAVKKYKPYGETPIGYALQEAAKDLGDKGQRTIVLVSDGEPTCEPDPCKVAAQLSKDGLELHIDVVGLDVSGKARKALQCVADAGNGDYFDAHDAKSLTESLDITSTRASRPFTFNGKSVRGTPELQEAPLITQGQYLDKVPGSGEISYRIKRTLPRSTIHVGLTLEGAAGSTGTGLRMELGAGASEDLDRCNDGLLHDSTLGEKHPLMFGSTSSWKQDPAHACNTSKDLYLTIKRADEEIAGYPMEIAVYEEPPLKDNSGRELPPSPDNPKWSTLKSQTAVEGTVPGTSIANAPVVKDGTYALDLNPGESQVLAVPVGWGQNLQAQLDARLTDKIKHAGGNGVEVHIIGPVRGKNEVSFYGNAPEDWTTTAFANLSYEPDKTFRTGAQSHTISFRNRGSSKGSVRQAALAGIHYVQVTYSVNDEVNMPYTLTLQTNDTNAEAAPDYAKVETLSVPRADSKLVTEKPSKTAKDTKKKSDASQAAEHDFPVPAAVFGIAGIIVVIAAGTIITWRFRRKH